MTTPTAQHPRITDRRRPVVLFIEDNLTQLDVYAMLIEHELGVVKASRGLTGLDLAIAEPPDVIVLDLLLPDIDGFALAERLWAAPATASIPIVVLTGDDVGLLGRRQWRDSATCWRSRVPPIGSCRRFTTRAARDVRRAALP